MDLRDVAEVLGNFGELIGAVGVLVTLVYFAIQIRENLKANRAQALSTWNAAAQAEKEALFRDSNFARIYRGTVGEPLQGDDEVKFYAYCIQIMNTWQLAFILCQLGVMKREFLEQACVGYAGFASAGRVAGWWSSSGAQMYGNEFVESVNSRIGGES